MHLRETCIVYFHGNDWNGVPGRQRLLMEALAPDVPVIFLDGTRDRRLRVTHFRPCANVVVLRGLASILNSCARRGWNRLARLCARVALAKYVSGRQVIFWGAENIHCLQRFVRHDFLVHDLIDPCLGAHSAAAFAEREASQCREADVVFCTAEALLDVARQANPRSHLVPNACSPADFTGAEQTLETPPLLHGRRRPYVGYMGTLDSRLDIPALRHAAAELADATFVLVGPVLREQEEALRPLRDLPNVVFAGPQFGGNAAAFAQAFNVCLIPFAAGPASDALNPVKLYTYLASGKRVVTTWIKECVRHRDLVEVTRTPPEFAAAIRQAADFDDVEKTARGIAFARENTWAQRASAVLAILRGAPRAEAAAPRESTLHEALASSPAAQ